MEAINTKIFMIQFKKDFKKILPYNRAEYISYLRDDTYTNLNWHGLAFQLPGNSEGQDISLKKLVDLYEPLFKNIVLRLDNRSAWIVNHEGYDWKWFPNEEENLKHLRALFKQNSVPNAFKGALIFATEDLLKFSEDLISYPVAVFNDKGRFYRSLDISHGELQFIIKIDGHFDIDLLSTDADLLRDIANENRSDAFIIKQYRGTSLW